MCEAHVDTHTLLSDVEFNEKETRDIDVESEPLIIGGARKQPRYFRRCLATCSKYIALFLAGVLTSTIFFSPWSGQTSLKKSGHAGFVPSHFPIKDEIRFKTESLPPDFWHNEFLWGQPHYESNNVWYEDVVGVRGFRVSPEEAARLQIKQSVKLQPGEDFATILGIAHNLHCLNAIRQLMYPEYFYPNTSQADLDFYRHHSHHCFEAIRTSMTCYPDLNPYPYFWSGNVLHDATVNTSITRQCVDWEALQTSLAPRNFDLADMIRDEHAVTR